MGRVIVFSRLKKKKKQEIMMTWIVEKDLNYFNMFLLNAKITLFSG